MAHDALHYRHWSAVTQAVARIPAASRSNDALHQRSHFLSLFPACSNPPESMLTAVHILNFQGCGYVNLKITPSNIKFLLSQLGLMKFLGLLLVTGVFGMC